MEIGYFIEQLNSNTHSATFQYWIVGEEDFTHRVNIDIPIPIPEGAAFDSFVCDICRSLVYQSERRKIIAASPSLDTLSARVGVTCRIEYAARTPEVIPTIPIRTV